MSGLDDQAQEDLGPEEEIVLWRQCREGRESARLRLVEMYLPFARYIAVRHYRQRIGDDVELAEYEQLASVGLLEAIARFDPGRGVQFRTFAGYRVEGAIKNGLAKTTEWRQQASWRQRTVRERLQGDADEGKQAESGVFAELTAVALELAIGLMLEDSGMVAPPTDESQDLQYERRAVAELRARVVEAVRSLPEREQRIVRYHYFEHVGFDELARIFEISKGRVSQLHRRALGRLREQLTGGGIDGYY